MQKNQRESLKAIQVLIPSRRPNLCNTELPPRDINHTFRIGNFLFGTFVCFKNNLPSSGWSMDIGGGTLQYTTRHSRNQNLQRFTMGRVKGLELRAIPILEPWELSPGWILDTS